MQAALPLNRRRAILERWFPNREWILLVALAVEAAVFSITGENFFSIANFFEIVRLSVELGLLALALTPVIVTGGIDLSVGSMMGLAAVIFGASWRDLGLPIPIAILLALIAGCLGGAINAFFITRLRIPAIIVTLGTYSMFRGIAEGITHAAVNYSSFPAGFLWLGQGYLGGIVPVQFPIFAAVFIAYAVLLHRSAIGRTIYAIGFSPEGARYAGIPVQRRLALVYFLSGLSASVAAVIYIAHLGQARSDAGNGYELAAITAVVLGGASVYGGRGTVWGTLFGLFSISVLQNGLRLSALPSELAGVLTGVVLVLTIALGRLRGQPASSTASTPGSNSSPNSSEDIEMRNSQLVVLCGVILTGALIVAASNLWLARSLRTPAFVAPASSDASAPAPAANGHKPVIAMMPKAKGDPYFVSCRAGAEEAAKELNVDFIWDGPTGLDAAKQNEVVESWITRRVDAIAVAVENAAGISTVLRKARERGIRVITWDADAEANARDYFINQATPEGIGNTLTDEAARLLHNKGEFAIITGALSAANQNLWIAAIKARLAARYPDLKLATIRPSDDDRDKAFSETQTILSVYPNVKLIMGISAPAVPGAAEAVRQSSRKDVNVIGLSLPSLNKQYVHSDVVQAVVLWDTRNLGYLTVYAASLLAEGKLPKTATSLQAGRLGTIQIAGDQILLGAPLIFNKANIDQYNF
jgi:rhamnose transport system permease protein